MSSYRRFLLDMHIPDWDTAFLSVYDPRTMATRWSKAGIGSVMLYCLSHVGLAYWPTKVGTAHGELAGRDFVGESLAACRNEGLETYAYYSAVLLHIWSRGIDFDHTGVSDFLGGDFHGGGLEQQMISRFMTGLS
ncbi:MAG: hypothetical protein ABIJ86_13190, partial [Spirochaetota bacterium]